MLNELIIEGNIIKIKEGREDDKNYQKSGFNNFGYCHGCN